LKTYVASLWFFGKLVTANTPFSHDFSQLILARPGTIWQNDRASIVELVEHWSCGPNAIQWAFSLACILCSRMIDNKTLCLAVATGSEKELT